MARKKQIKKKPASAARAKAKAKLPGDMTDAQKLARIIRVDHAGEYGAKRIYEGQLKILGKNPRLKKLIEEMKDHEQVHLDYFAKAIPQNRVRPTALLPLWHVGGFAMGAITALMGEKAAMACTVAVEEVIEDHYNKQLAELADEHPELKKTLRQFCDDEIHHRDIGLEHGAEDAPGYRLIYAAISRITKGAIWLSERV